MEKQIAISIQDVSKDFKLPHERVSSVKSLFVNPLQSKKNRKTETQHALRNVSFDVYEGEFFGIVGRNGSGKSTLLKMIAGIYRPTNGRAWVRGKLVPFIELGVGFNPELTGRDNVYLNGALMGFSRKEIDAMYDDIVSFAELDEFMDQKLKNYSSGMQVRLAFSMATRSKADILLIDEVLAVGDADFQRKCFQYFRGLKKSKTTVVFVSHDMDAIREYCDRCVMIDKSEIIYQGSPEIASEKYTQLFNERPAENKDQIEKRAERWGDGAARITQISTQIDAQKLIVKMEVEFRKKMENPIIGFQIKNSVGMTLCGTNSRVLQKKLAKYEKGELLRLTFSMPNVLGEDTFSVDAAVTHEDAITQADWWHGAASVINHNKYNTPHPVSPMIEMKIS